MFQVNVTVYLQIFKSRFLGQNIGRSVIFKFWKKSIEKDRKYWRRNCGLTFSPKVKAGLPLDWQSYDVMQSTKTTFAGLYRCEELATQLISHQWKCQWTSSKKRKKRTKNANIQQWANKQIKVGRKLKLRLCGDQAGKRSSPELRKTMVRLAHVLSG